MIDIKTNKIFTPSWRYFKNVSLSLLLCWGLYFICANNEAQSTPIEFELPKQYMAPLKELEGKDFFDNQAAL